MHILIFEKILQIAKFHVIYKGKSFRRASFETAGIKKYKKSKSTEVPTIAGGKKIAGPKPLR